MEVAEGKALEREEKFKEQVMIRILMMRIKLLMTTLAMMAMLQIIYRYRSQRIKFMSRFYSHDNSRY